MSGATIEFPVDGAWSEDGDRVWLLHQGETAGWVRHRAWRGQGLPVGFREMGADLIDLRVRVVYARYAPNCSYDEFPWKRAQKGEEGAVKCWELSA